MGSVHKISYDGIDKDNEEKLLIIPLKKEFLIYQIHLLMLRRCNRLENSIHKCLHGENEMML